jgi:5,10-methylene-tetrahydrofolate dehydrogenase/methenyl tetrahydrofolate cyclohydrolase
VKVLVIGRGMTVGRPLSILLSQKPINATVTLAHSASKNLTEIIKDADVLIAAMIGYACGKQVTSFKQKFFKHASSRFNIKTTVSTFACNEKTYPTFCITATPR